MTADLLMFLNVIAIPAIGAILTWLWKLEQRIFDLNRGVLTRDEFVDEMRRLRDEITELRKVVKS